MMCHFSRYNELSKYTKAKGYQTEEDFDALLVNCHNRYQKQMTNGSEPTRSLKEQLEDIHKYAVQTPLSARFVQTCYSQTIETYLSWLTKLEDVIRSYLTNSSVSEQDEFFLVSCYRINKHHLQCGQRVSFVPMSHFRSHTVVRASWFAQRG